MMTGMKAAGPHQGRPRAVVTGEDAVEEEAAVDLLLPDRPDLMCNEQTKTNGSCRARDLLKMCLAENTGTEKADGMSRALVGRCRLPSDHSHENGEIII